MKFHRSVPAAALAAGFVLFSLPAMAAQYPVTGSVTFSSGAESLPAGVAFGDSSYDGNSGYLSAGQFTFPQASATTQTDFGAVVVTYQLSQTNSATALVDSAGNAVFTTVEIKLHIVSVTLGGFPLGVGNACDFQPITWDELGGTASGTGMDVSQTSFSVPPTQDSCGGKQSQINAALAGNDNSISLHLVGGFPPPANSDLIFLDGFESLQGN